MKAGTTLLFIETVASCAEQLNAPSEHVTR